MRKNKHTHIHIHINDGGAPRTPLTDLMVYVVPKKVYTKRKNTRITGDNDNSAVYNYIQECIYTIVYKYLLKYKILCFTGHGSLVLAVVYMP